MKDYISQYLLADQLRGYISNQRRKELLEKQLLTTYLQENIPELLKANGLIQIVETGKYSILKIIAAGEDHLKSGGFKNLLKLEDVSKSMPQITFRKHLENNVNLLAIF